MEDIHVLAPPEPKAGGLIIKKKDPDEKKDVFKVPKVSKYGLDILAKKLRKERELGLLTSFKDDDTDQMEEKLDAEEDNKFKQKSIDLKTKNYRSTQEETPTYTGGVSKSVKEHYHERISDKSKGIYASSSKEKSDDKKRDRDRDKYKSSSRDYKDRKRSRHESSRSSSRRDRDRDRSYRSRDPETPRVYEGKSSLAKSSWDDDDFDYYNYKKKKSSWDFPTPDIPRYRSDDSIRSNRSSKSSSSRKNDKYDNDTPRPTPAHKFNKWAADRKHSGATPRTDVESSTRKPWENEEDKDLWEEEQIRLDREWYNMDEGYDEENNPFASTSSEYLKKREEQLEIRKRKRMSAQQRQINKDNELWEKNRMITSGVVMSINVNEDFEEETIDRVNLLVHHTVPPFLDGRIVFTKTMGNNSYFKFKIIYNINY
jgi:pre-mRNA-splicing factor ATP-dependent RNA helicase DHX38/PRP16